MDIATIFGVSAAALVACGAAGAMRWVRDNATLGHQDADGFHQGEPVPAVAEPANDTMPDLTTDQWLVLSNLSEEIGFRASTLAKYTGLSEKHVSVIRRELADLGLAFYGPLFDEDSGRPAGSGYLLTPEGADAVANFAGDIATLVAA